MRLLTAAVQQCKSVLLQVSGSEHASTRQPAQHEPVRARPLARHKGYGILDGNYLITGIIGEGGNGLVFKAVDIHSGPASLHHAWLCIKVSMTDASMEVRPLNAAKLQHAQLCVTAAYHACFVDCAAQASRVRASFRWLPLRYRGTAIHAILATELTKSQVLRESTSRIVCMRA